ncbi:hypothetical protein CF319_g4607 [Tilletia indica]|nr:hypothetical protein CF319_g4607 [Tilletia indica]
MHNSSSSASYQPYPGSMHSLPPPPLPTAHSRPDQYLHQQQRTHSTGGTSFTPSASMNKKSAGKQAATATTSSAAAAAAPSNGAGAYEAPSSSSAGAGAAMDDDNDMDGEGDDPSKRRRVARACDSCRKKKVRCDGIDPPRRDACTNCSTYGHDCTFLNAAKRRAPPRSYVDALEARMAKMETLLTHLAPGVDFTDKVGPPVVLPDGDNQDDPNAAGNNGCFDASTANPIIRGSTASEAFCKHLASGPGVVPGMDEISQTRLNLEGGDDDAENIGILLQQRIEGLRMNSPTIGDPSMPDHHYHHYHSPAHSGEAGTPLGEEGGVIRPLLSVDATRNFSQPNMPFSVLASDDTATKAMTHGDTAIFFGHSSNFMLYPQLEKLSLGVPQDTANPHRLRFVQDPWNVPEIYAESEGPPLETIDLQWPDPDLQARLVDAYFEYVHPTIPILNEAIFRDQLANHPECREDRYWLALCLGVFSVGSRFVDDERLVKCPKEYEHARWLLGTHWLEARKLLGFRMFPTTLCLPQLQGLILSAFFLQATPVNGTMGWALLGVAIRLMQAHGVHRRAVNRARRLPVHVDEQWKRCFWVCYNLDVELSSNMGRPIGVHEDDFDLDFPLEVDDDVLWEAGKNVLARSAGQGPGGGDTAGSNPSSPSMGGGTRRASVSERSAPTDPKTSSTRSTPTSPTTTSFSTSTAGGANAADPTDPIKMQGNRPVKFITSFNATLKLNMISARILRTIYMLPKARIARGYLGYQAPQFVVAEIDSALNDWINSIPFRIRFDPHEPDDQMLVQSSYVHMRYYNAQILTHRPFISGTRQDNPNFASVAICTNAARSCSHILDTLRKRKLLGHATMPAVGHAFISGCVLLMVIWSARKTGARLSGSTVSDVNKCVEALKAMERSAHPAAILGAALNEMIVAAELRMASDSAGNNASQKRTHDDSVNDEFSPTQQPAAVPNSTGTTASSTGAGGPPPRTRRRPRSSGRRSANGSSASLPGVTNNAGNSGGADGPPLPLSTQELIEPFHSSMSSASTPEQNGPQSGQQQHQARQGGRFQQQQQQPNSFPGNMGRSGSEVDVGRAMGLPTHTNGLGNGANLSSWSFSSPGGGAARSSSYSGQGGLINSTNGPYRSSGSPSSSSASGPSMGAPAGNGVVGSNPMSNMFGNGNAPASGSTRGPAGASLDFTSSSYDPMRIAAENADYQLLGNPAMWNSGSFNENSFPAFADVAMAGGAGGSGMNEVMGMGMAGMDMGMAMGMGFVPNGMGGVAGFQTLPGLMGSSAGAAATVQFAHDSAAHNNNNNNNPSSSSARNDQETEQQRRARMSQAVNGGDGAGGAINPETGESAPEQCLRMMDEHIANHLHAHGPGGGGGAGEGQQHQHQMSNAQTPLANAAYPYGMSGNNQGFGGGGGGGGAGAGAGAGTGGNQGATNSGGQDPFSMLYSQSFF